MQRKEIYKLREKLLEAELQIYKGSKRYTQQEVRERMEKLISRLVNLDDNEKFDK